LRLSSLSRLARFRRNPGSRGSGSRYWGFVNRRAIMGRPIVIWWSVKATAEHYSDGSLHAPRCGIEDALTHLPSRTRWHLDAARNPLEVI
jgi:hypothetical protein